MVKSTHDPVTPSWILYVCEEKTGLTMLGLNDGSGEGKVLQDGLYKKHSMLTLRWVVILDPPDFIRFDKPYVKIDHYYLILQLNHKSNTCDFFVKSHN